MKTADDIDKARTIIVENLGKDLNPMQRAILSGVSMALCWCAGVLMLIPALIRRWIGFWKVTSRASNSPRKLD